ncbi:MAG TPA: PglZ domain-containing protein [Chromatiales bacterium]|nr:PglZ domain-containing protein [Chromatiales bacterium]
MSPATTPVSDYIHAWIADHLRKHGILVWYDPQGHYRKIVDRGWSDVPVLHYQNSFLALRRDGDKALEAGSTRQRLGEKPGPLLIYLNCTPQETRYALVELETAGLRLAPGEPSPPGMNADCDTSLIHLAARALRETLPEEVVEEVVQKIREGVITLEDLDDLVRPPEIPIELTTFYDTQDPIQIGLKFLADEDRDEAIQAQNRLQGLIDFFARFFDLRRRDFSSPSELRLAVATHLLINEAALASGDLQHAAWQGQPLITTPAAQGLIVKTVKRWRNDRDLAALYATLSTQVAAQGHLPLDALPSEMLARIETFATADDLLLERAAAALATSKLDPDTRAWWRDVVARREQGFWAREDDQRRQSWHALSQAVAFLELGEGIGKELAKGRRWRPGELLRAYADETSGWYRLDRSYRSFELARDALADDPRLAFTKLENRVRDLYHERVGRMATLLIRAWERRSETAEAQDIPLQRHIFRDAVAPLLRHKRRVAYILVDALRYELAWELVEALRRALARPGAPPAHQVVIEPWLGVLPGITPLGMAALLPGAEHSLGLLEQKGSVIPEVNGQTIPNREARMAYLREQVQGHVGTFTIEDLRAASKRLIAKLEKLDFIVVTSQEIDIAAETQPPIPTIFHFVHVLRDLTRTVRTLARAGVDEVLITADHGFLLFGAPIKEGYLIPAPDGNALKIGRRYWIGHQLGLGDGFLAQSAADLGLTGGLEYAFPQGLSIFKASGGDFSYFHGGISLQEVTVPLIRISLAQGISTPPRAPTARKIEWVLTPSRDRITGKVFSVTVSGEARELLALAPRRVRLEVQANGKPCEVILAHTSCESDTSLNTLILQPLPGEQIYAPCTVTLQFKEYPETDHVTLFLYDATTDNLLAGPVHIALDIAIR